MLKLYHAAFIVAWSIMVVAILVIIGHVQMTILKEV